MSNRTLSLPPPFWVDKAIIHDTEATRTEDKWAFLDVFELMLELHREGGYAPLNREKAEAAVYAVLKEGMTFLARLEDGPDAGAPIGVLAMMEMPFWYGDSTFLIDQGFYVKPAYRKGRVGVELLKAARAEAQARGRIAIIAVTNPDRPPKKTKATVISQYAGFVPLGYTLKLR